MIGYNSSNEEKAMKRRFVRLTIFVLLMIPAFTITSQPKPDPAERYEVEVAEVSASSFVTSEKGNVFRYHPVMAFDGDPTTAWNEGASGNGIDEELVIRFYDDIIVDAISIMPGYYDKQWYAANNRIKRIEVSLQITSAKWAEPIDFDFTDGMDVKWIRFPPRKINYTDFKIKDVYPGTKYDDTCISEISFYYKNKSIQLKGITEFKRILDDNKNFTTPSGLMVYIPVYPMLEDAYYFFHDGVCLSVYVRDAAQSVQKGTWKYVSETDQIVMDFTIQEVFEGIGDGVQEYSDILAPWYYKNYKYYVKQIKESRIEKWREYRNNTLNQYASRLLTSRDYRLREIPRPDFQKTIEGLRRKYREVVEKQRRE